MTGKSALLFDLDGTLVDTDSLHLRAYEELLANYGRTITTQEYKSRIMGAPNNVIMEYLFPELSLDYHLSIAERKETIFRGLVRDLEPTLGLTGLLEWADSKAIPMAVVTNAPRLNAELMLTGIRLEHLISRLIIGEELARGKPDPLPYEMGLKLTGANAASSIAFEDSLSGVRSASSAGLFTYGVTTSLPPDRLIEAGANKVIDNFTDAHLWEHLRSLADGTTVKQGSR